MLERIHPMTGLAVVERDFARRVVKVRTWPIRKGGVTGRCGSFGYTRMNADGTRRFHRGLDLLAELDSPIYAAHDGHARIAARVPGFGLAVYLVGADPWGGPEVCSIYAHLSALHVRPGDQVEAGELLGRCGRSGFQDEGVPTHLHFETRIGGSQRDDARDPEEWLYETTENRV